MIMAYCTILTSFIPHNPGQAKVFPPIGLEVLQFRRKITQRPPWTAPYLPGPIRTGLTCSTDLSFYKYLEGRKESKGYDKDGRKEGSISRKKQKMGKEEDDGSKEGRKEHKK